MVAVSCFKIVAEHVGGWLYFFRNDVICVHVRRFSISIELEQKHTWLHFLFYCIFAHTHSLAESPRWNYKGFEQVKTSCTLECRVYT